MDRYLVEHNKKLEALLAFYEASGTLREAIRRGAFAEKTSDGRMDRHQFRIPRNHQPLIHQSLLDSEQSIANAGSFCDLYNVVKLAISAVKPKADLMFYDTALRLGAFLHHEPRMVYLQRGALDGARKLGLNLGRQRKVPMESFPGPMRRLCAAQIENFLCVFKDDLGHLDL